MPLVDNQRWYKQRPQPMSDEGVLFLLLTIKEMEHLQLYHFLKLTAPLQGVQIHYVSETKRYLIVDILSLISIEMILNLLSKVRLLGNYDSDNPQALSLFCCMVYSTTLVRILLCLFKLIFQHNTNFKMGILVYECQLFSIDIWKESEIVPCLNQVYQIRTIRHLRIMVVESTQGLPIRPR